MAAGGSAVLMAGEACVSSSGSRVGLLDSMEKTLLVHRSCSVAQGMLGCVRQDSGAVGRIPSTRCQCCEHHIWQGAAGWLHSCGLSLSGKRGCSKLAHSFSVLRICWR